MVVEMVKRFGAVVVVAVLMVGAAACGGGGGENAEVVNESSGQTTDGSAEREEVDRSSTDTGSLRDGVDELSDLFGGELDGLGKCMEIGVAYMSVSFGAFGAMFGGADEVADIQRELADLEMELPSEIRDDFQVIADAFADFAKELEGASGNIMDPEFQKRMEDASAALESSAVSEAQENIEAYLQKECPDFAGGASN